MEGGVPAVQIPFDPAVPREDGRHLCFVKYAAEDQMCTECPSQIRPQCEALVGTAQASASGVNAELAALQNSLAGV